jgi:hypothetical protein
MPRVSLLWQYYNDTIILATSYLTLSSDIVKDGGIEVDGGYLNFMDSGGIIVGGDVLCRSFAFDGATSCQMIPIDSRPRT